MESLGTQHREPGVSIVVVNWNTKDSLRACLASVYDQTDADRIQTIVIDNGSTDGSAEMVRTQFAQVTLIANQENRGFAAANNQGMRIAKGRYVLLLNPDTIVLDRAIEKTVAYADQHLDVAVVGCQVWETPEAVQMTCMRFPSALNVFLSTFWLAKAFKHNRVIGREWMHWWKRDTERDVDVVSGMYMLVRREAIDQVGLMDEAFFVYAEEADWCYRFRKAGWGNRFWPGARILHVHGGSHSSRQAAVGMFVQEQKSLLIFLRKHYGSLHCGLARAILAVSFGLRVCAYGMLYPIKRLTGRDTGHSLQRLARSFATFKFVALGIEPESIRGKGNRSCLSA